MSVVNKALVRRLYEEAFGQGKPEVLDEVVDPNYVCWDPNAEGGAVRGLETLKGEIAYFHQGFPEDFFWRVEEQVAEGDKVTTRYTMGGTHQGEFFGVPATGKRGGMRQGGAIREPGQEEEATAAEGEQQEEKGLMDKAREKLTGQ